MFICRSCAKRATAFFRPNAVFEVSVRPHPRLLSTTSTTRQQATTFAEIEQAQEEPRTEVENVGQRKKSKPNIKWIVRKHLEHMKDPYKIAGHVKETLMKGKYEEALALTQEASKNAQCVVSWNHLIDYQMRQQRLHAAIKLFNEMKKRSQLPNAQTYTTIFRGCAHSRHPDLAVAEAIRLYHSMTRSSRIEPNQIHLNAVMQVCARADDLASMFSILETADRPARSADGTTYTIILNALGAQCVKRRLESGLDDEQVLKQNRLQAVARAKTIWEEVISRWRRGYIVVDEDLVCAMGRVLLHGDHHDHDNILTLVEQTMGITRLDRDQVVTENTGKAIQKTSYGYVVPGRNALSLIMQALERLRRSSLAPKYWDILTEEYRIIPDADNWFRYMRVFAKAGASAKAAEVVQMMPVELLTPKTFRLAFKVCVRDNLNVNAFDNANIIFDDMKQALKAPDCEALRLYLEVALGNHRKFKLLEEAGDYEASKIARGQQIVKALDRLWEPLRLAQNALAYPDIITKSPEEEWERTYEARAALISLSKMIVAATDRLVSENMVDNELSNAMKIRRNLLNRQVVRHYERYGKMKSRGKKELKAAEGEDESL